MDPGLEPTDVAPLADAGLTAYHSIRKAVPLLYPGTRCAVIGAGGLGHIGIQCLKAMVPAEIIVLDTNEEALSLATEWGAGLEILREAALSEQPGEAAVLAVHVVAVAARPAPVSYTHLRAHETRHDLVCRLLLEKKKK